MTQKGRGLFLGQPVGTPTGLSIGKPGLLIFAAGGTDGALNFVYNQADTLVFSYDTADTLVFSIEV